MYPQYDHLQQLELAARTMMDTRTWYLLTLLVLTVLWSVSTAASDQGSSSGGRADISTDFVYALAPRGSQDPVKIMAGQSELQFKPVPPRGNIARNPDEIWLQTALYPEQLDFNPAVLEMPAFMLRKVDAWFALPDGSIVHQQAGRQSPYDQRPVKHANTAFRVPRTETGPVKILIRIDTGTPVNFTAILWSEQHWSAHVIKVRGWYGILLGGLSVLLLYTLFLALSLRDSSYLYYAGYLACMIITIVLYSGLSEEYVFTEGKKRIYILMVAGVGAFLGVAFINTFLDIRRKHKILYFISMFVTAFGAALGASILWHVHIVPPLIASPLMHGILVSGTAYYVGMALYSYARGIKQARFLVLGMGLLLSALVVHFMFVYGVITYSIYRYHALEAGILAEAILMSLALADRIKILTREKETLGNQVISMQKCFTRQMVDFQEGEKKKFAGVLHDSVGHGLLVLKQDLDRLHKAPLSVRETAVVTDMRTQCAQLMDEVRSLSHELHPHILRHLGLSAALHSIMQRAFGSTGIDWFMDIDESLPSLSPDIEMTLYRVTQEAISNIIKYAQASEVYCSLHQHDQSIHMEIKDDGTGFDSGMTPYGIGLKMMKGNVQLLDGTFDLATRLQMGTRIQIAIPLQENC